MNQIPAGESWAGLNREVAPHLLGVQHSPDCVNVCAFDGLQGLLGPRKGRTRATGVTNRVTGIVPYDVAGGGGEDFSIIVAQDDGTIQVVAWPQDPPAWPPGGGGVTSLGFYTEVALAGATGSPAVDNEAGTLNVDVNGATKAIVTPCSAEFIFEGAIYVYLEFDNVMGLTPAMTVVVEPGGCCGGLTVTCQSVPVDCTGKLKLTGVKCEAEEMGETSVLDGTIQIMGVKV